MKNDIIYEDTDLLLINKPAGVIVNRADTTKNEVTVQDWAEAHMQIYTEDVKHKFHLKFGDEEWTPEIDFYKRGGIVHRLDKETSGVLLVAKNPFTFVDLQSQFRERTIKKVYTALAHGVIDPLQGEIAVPVGRLPWNRTKFGVLSEGRESKTIYKVDAVYQNPITNEKLSWVKLYPQSGRTHQLRVHLQYMGHPIFADFLYAGRKTARTDRKLVPRVFLHAESLSFSHPRTKKVVTFDAPLMSDLLSGLKHFTKVLAST